MPIYQLYSTNRNVPYVFSNLSKSMEKHVFFISNHNSNGSIVSQHEMKATV